MGCILSDSRSQRARNEIEEQTDRYYCDACISSLAISVAWVQLPPSRYNIGSASADHWSRQLLQQLVRREAARRYYFAGQVKTSCQTLKDAQPRLHVSSQTCIHTGGSKGFRSRLAA